MAAIIMWALLYIAACIWTMKRELQKRQKKERRKIIWGYAEQRLAPGLHALLQGSFQSGTSRGCKSYAGTGLTWQCGKTEGGLFTDYARFSPSYEWASEFTWKIPFSGNGFIQPTLHFIQQAGSTLSDWLIALQLCTPDYLTFIILRQIHQ